MSLLYEPIDFTNLARVKRYLNITDTNDDLMFTQLICDWSMAAQRFMGRAVKQVEREEDFSVQRAASVIRLPAFGSGSVIPADGIKHDLDRDFTDPEDVVDPTDYAFNERTGLIKFDFQLTPGNQVLRVKWTGGLAPDTATLFLDYPDLAGAVDQQISHIFQHKEKLGVQAAGMQDQSTTLGEAPGRWLRSVKEILARYRAFSLAS